VRQFLPVREVRKQKGIYGHLPMLFSPHHNSGTHSSSFRRQFYCPDVRLALVAVVSHIFFRVLQNLPTHSACETTLPLRAFGGVQLVPMLLTHVRPPFLG
jgi:hypothetical protein